MTTPNPQLPVYDVILSATPGENVSIPVGDTPQTVRVQPGGSGGASTTPITSSTANADLEAGRLAELFTLSAIRTLGVRALLAGDLDSAAAHISRERSK